MNVLAFDTCFSAVSVAVRWKSLQGTWLVRDAIEARERGHAERLMPMIADVLDDAGLAFSDIERIAVTVGPGSFTGVRTGIAAARGLALASGRELVGATSLAVMARVAAERLPANDRSLAVAMDARRGMVYVQIFDAAGCELGAARLLGAEAVPALVGRQPVTIVGSGAAAVAGAITAAGGEAEVSLVDLQPEARALARMAPALAPVSPLLPLYLRPPDAKPQGDKTLARAAS